jgi:hypothetical protein
MINLQLHAHEQQRVQWQGEAWPGQPLQWDVRREAREDGRGQEGQGQDGGEQPGKSEAAQVWRSGLRLRLPLLGKLSASVTLAGDQLSIQLQAADGASAETLRACAGRLQAAMEAAGAPLSSLTIGSAPSEDTDAA